MNIKSGKVGGSNENKRTILGWTLARLCNEVRYMFKCIHEQKLYSICMWFLFEEGDASRAHSKKRHFYFHSLWKPLKYSQMHAFPYRHKRGLERAGYFPFNCHKSVLFILTMKLCSSYITPTFIQFLMKTECSFPFSSN